MKKLFIGAIRHDNNYMSAMLLDGINKEEAVGCLYVWVKDNHPEWNINEIFALEQPDGVLNFLGWIRDPETLDI